MFYSDFSGEKRQLFTLALQAIKTCFARMFAGDNMIMLNRNQSYLRDQKFVTAFTNNATTEQEKSLIWRLHTLAWATQHCKQIEGDFVECGVYLGFSMSVIAEYLELAQLAKNLYLYDTFTGIPAEYNSENRSNIIYEKQTDIYDRVVAKFKKYPNVKIVKGIVPKTFAENCPDKIAFLHIDMNSSKSELAALEYLYDRVSDYGIIVFDDFGWLGYDQQTYREIEFMAKRGQNIMELPTGQGLLIKTKQETKKGK